LHYAIGQKAKELKIDKLLGLGELSKAAVAAFGESATHYTNKSNLIADLLPHATKISTILIKGSRGMRMEDIVLALTDARETHPC
jgi:UDP-N-acetylmuramoyl-tripeptide--D-alanyl-D-alanine ligase